MASTKTEIQSASVARGTDKSTHEVYYVVKSDTSDTTWYSVRWNNSSLAWECNCPSYKPCKHERAVNQVLAVRRQQIALAMGAPVPAIVAKLQEQEDKRLAERETRGTLSSNQGFSLLR